MLHRSNRDESLLNTSFYYETDFSMNVNYKKGFKDFREMLLAILSIVNEKSKSFSSVLTDTIEYNQRYKQGSNAERGYIFGNKKYIKEEDLPAIRKVLTEAGFVMAFVNNSGINQYRKSSLTYSELYVINDDKHIPQGAMLLTSVRDPLLGYDIEIEYVGNVELGTPLGATLDKYLHKRKYLPTIAIATKIIDYGDGPFVQTRDEILEDDAEVALPSFYPWLDRSISQFSREYMASNAPVLILTGPTGTGKTTFIRSIAKEVNAVCLTVSDLHIASNPLLFDTYKERIKKAIMTDDPRPHILVLEDVDTLLLSRARNNREMSRFLNESKGLGSNKNIKIIFSTNVTDVSVIDTALVRPGRCFRMCDCRNLTIEEAMKVRRDLKFDDIDLTKYAVDGMISLAAAIEETIVENVVVKAANDNKVTFGFPELKSYSMERQA